MLIRIDDSDANQMPHKLVFPDLARLLRERMVPHITAWQTLSHDNLPAMRVRIGNAPPHGTTREIPDENVQLIIESNTNHPR